MKNYIEITLVPGADIGLYFLWQKVYKQIHRGLVSIKNSEGNIPIGVSFPEYDEDKNLLGSKLIIFGRDRQTLELFMATKCLNRLFDYIHVSEINEVPENVNSHVIFKRLQVKSSIPRIARRKAKREGIEFEEAMTALKDVEEKRVDTPFINIESESSNKKFCLFIVKQAIGHSIGGEFNCYGLSNESATVPWF